MCVWLLDALYLLSVHSESQERYILKCVSWCIKGWRSFGSCSAWGQMNRQRDRFCLGRIGVEVNFGRYHCCSVFWKLISGSFSDTQKPAMVELRVQNYSVLDIFNKCVQKKCWKNIFGDALSLGASQWKLIFWQNKKVLEAYDLLLLFLQKELDFDFELDPC